MSFLEKIFKDKECRVTLIQAPNLPIIIFTIAFVISNLTSGNVKNFFDALAFGSLFTFAWLELFDGANYFRKGLGIAVLLGLLVSKI